MTLTQQQLELIATGTIQKIESTIIIDSKELTKIHSFGNFQLYFHNGKRITPERYHDIYYTQPLLNIEYNLNNTEVIHFKSPKGTISVKYYQDSVESIERIHYNSDNILVKEQSGYIKEIK